jgi:hypothetical protein
LGSPSPIDRTLPLLERAAIAGRMPDQPAAGAGPGIIARHTLA